METEALAAHRNPAEPVPVDFFGNILKRLIKTFPFCFCIARVG